MTEQLQMPGNPRLALADDGGDFADRQFAAHADGQQAQACGLGDRLESVQ